MAGRIVRSCVQTALKAVNSVVGLAGMAVILYALWMLRAWYREVADLDQRFPVPWSATASPSQSSSSCFSRSRSPSLLLLRALGAEFLDLQLFLVFSPNPPVAWRNAFGFQLNSQQIVLLYSYCFIGAFPPHSRTNQLRMPCRNKRSRNGVQNEPTRTPPKALFFLLLWQLKATLFGWGMGRASAQHTTIAADLVTVSDA